MHDIDDFLRATLPNLQGVSLSHATDINCLLYADDLALLATSPVQLNLLLRGLTAYTVANDLVINTEKSKVVVFRKGGRLPFGTHFELDGKELQIVNEYQYLGVWFSSSGSFSKNALETSCKAERAGAALRGLLSRVGRYSSDQFNTLSAAKVTSTLLHASEIWAHGHYDTLQLPVYRFIKKLFVLPACTPHHILQQEFSPPHVKTKIVKRTFQWLAKVAAMDACRLPRVCMDAQALLLIRNSHCETWLSLVWRLLSGAGIGADPALWQELDWIQLRDQVVIHEDRQVFIGTLERAMNSEQCPMYRCLTRRSTFIGDESLSTLRLLLQLTLINSRAPRLWWDGIIVRFQPQTRCPLCNSGASDSPPHFILDCPVLAGYRPTAVAQLASLPGPDTVRLATVINHPRLRIPLARFIATAIRVRDFLDHV